MVEEVVEVPAFSLDSLMAQFPVVDLVPLHRDYDSLAGSG
jgi:hypothetical protein